MKTFDRSRSEIWVIKRVPPARLQFLPVSPDGTHIYVSG
jgi:hypothetical protein